METYRAALIGCSRMGAFIDNEVTGHPAHPLPYSHAAGYEAVKRTKLIACSDLRPEVMAQVGLRYGIARESQYLDYKEMIRREKPDIVSIATQPEGRADIVRFAAEQGVKAIYCEKAMAASMAESEAIVAAIEQHGVAFNLSTQRRWSEGYVIFRRFIESQELGVLKSLVSYSTGTLFNTGSHCFDLLNYLNGDTPVQWVQASLTTPDSYFNGEVVTEDPIGHGIIQYANGVTAYALNTIRTAEFEAVFENGILASTNNGVDWHLRRRASPHVNGRALVSEPFPAFEFRSGTQGIIEDLVHALDTGSATRGNVRAARSSTEIIFAFMESHRRGGSRVEIPLRDCNLRLVRSVAPKQPKYTA